ncbi:PREDICTED: serine-rich single-pass membrane protein 1 [Tinamus guttatus]|uniref:serine-rich single-pass membrane protein 1 n=1 Tax=Tinamus guttatus TaxID=94827 RepID=UPI00052EB621|nr:PREDICTED: serine-rich single-pass membrane protein 1 [Tinamus guttatus]
MESVDENLWASVWKENEAELVLAAAGCRQRAAAEQRDAGSYWIREQPCPHCKAERTRQWLSQHFFKPISPPPASDASLEEDFYQAINP